MEQLNSSGNSSNFTNMRFFDIRNFLVKSSDTDCRIICHTRNSGTVQDIFFQADRGNMSYDPQKEVADDESISSYVLSGISYSAWGALKVFGWMNSIAMTMFVLNNSIGMFRQAYKFSRGVANRVFGVEEDILKSGYLCFYLVYDEKDKAISLISRDSVYRRVFSASDKEEELFDFVDLREKFIDTKASYNVAKKYKGDEYDVDRLTHDEKKSILLKCYFLPQRNKFMLFDCNNVVIPGFSSTSTNDYSVLSSVVIKDEKVYCKYVNEDKKKLVDFNLMKPKGKVLFVVAEEIGSKEIYYYTAFSKHSRKNNDKEIEISVSLNNDYRENTDDQEVLLSFCDKNEGNSHDGDIGTKLIETGYRYSIDDFVRHGNDEEKLVAYMYKNNSGECFVSYRVVNIGREVDQEVGSIDKNISFVLRQEKGSSFVFMSSDLMRDEIKIN